MQNGNDTPTGDGSAIAPPVTNNDLQAVLDTAADASRGASLTDPALDAEPPAPLVPAKPAEPVKPAEPAKPAKSPTLTTKADLRAALASLAAEGGNVLTAAAILATDDLTYRIVAVPEWGGSVIVRSGTGTERDAFETSLVVVKGKKRETNTLNIRAKLCALAIVDPADPELKRPQFKPAQVLELGAKSAAALSRVYNDAADLWGLSEADVEELAGNSAGADSGDSSGT